MLVLNNSYELATTYLQVFFALDVLFRTCCFICLRLFCRNRSFYPCLRSFNFTREPRIHLKNCGWKSRAHFAQVLIFKHFEWTMLCTYA